MAWAAESCGLRIARIGIWKCWVEKRALFAGRQKGHFLLMGRVFARPAS
jgi:hypothetical protein